jgi:hypothetical protein
MWSQALNTNISAKCSSTLAPIITASHTLAMERHTDCRTGIGPTRSGRKSHENGFSYIELRTQDIKKGLFGRPTSHARSCGICKMGNNLVNRETIRSDFLWPGVSRGEGLIQHRGSPSKLMGQTDMPLIMSNINIAKLRPGCFTIRWFIAIFYSYICWRVK